MEKLTVKTIDEYIALFPVNIQEKLLIIYNLVKETAPNAEELISYGMPAFKQNGMLVYFAAFKNHISFFPGISGVEHFKQQLIEYKASKGTIQIPLDKDIPVDLFREIILFRMAENEAKKQKKQKNKNI